MGVSRVSSLNQLLPDPATTCPAGILVLLLLSTACCLMLRFLLLVLIILPLYIESLGLSLPLFQRLFSSSYFLYHWCWQYYYYVLLLLLLLLVLLVA